MSDKEITQDFNPGFLVLVTTKTGLDWTAKTETFADAYDALDDWMQKRERAPGDFAWIVPVLAESAMV